MPSAQARESPTSRHPRRDSRAIDARLATLEATVKSQGLLAPETVELLPAAAEVVRDNVSLLREMGFGLADFGGDAFIVDAIPACLGGVAAHAVLAAVAESLSKGGTRGGVGRRTPGGRYSRLAMPARRRTMAAGRASGSF